MKLQRDEKRLLAKVNRLELDLGYDEHPQAGLVEALHGYVDPAKRDLALATYDELLAQFPSAEYYKYLRAGFLARIGRLAEAEEAYRRIVADKGHYYIPAKLGLVGVHWHRGDETEAQRELDEYNRLAASSGHMRAKTTAVEMFACCLTSRWSRP